MHWSTRTGCTSHSASSSRSPFKVLHGIAPEYLGPVARVADLPGRQAPSSACNDPLHGGATVQTLGQFINKINHFKCLSEWWSCVWKLEFNSI
jgi:hypothetical protein